MKVVSRIFHLFRSEGLSIEPNHDKPCIVGDAWAEECMSCTCTEGHVAICRSTLCASRLRRALDQCREGEITRLDCNSCVCKNNRRVCTKYKCNGKSRTPDSGWKRQSKKYESSAKAKGGLAMNLVKRNRRS
ncbi:uncharacterized protein LOC107271361 isoform X2 [Cephus cinctus]|uniref:Uncharacterized protein LOC107271361 isoform X2 n=1 Tax=Cephus cinctus TaxID=211228 RepID=A0AAJ7FQ43_CEPCN|nr:uncharacterized protein LOC107271361 isoform X2 [Cephus cinctus]